jgi:hypothetical protein
MLGQLTRGQAATPDTSKLMLTLESLGRGESDAAYLAKRLAVGIERQTFPDDIVTSLAEMPSSSVMTLISRLTARNATIYDLPRHLVLLLAQKFATGPKGPRSLQL